MTPSQLPAALERIYGSPLPDFQVLMLRGDASTRRYYRVRVDAPAERGPETLIVMQLPEDAFASDEGGNDEPIETLPFLEIAELLGSRGLPVPCVYVEALPDRLLLLEDLGDVTFKQRLDETPRSAWASLYGKAIDLLAEVHERCAALPPGSIAARRRFDRALLDWELDHFRQWGLEAPFGPLGGTDADRVRDSFATIASDLEAMPYGFVHRDFQSKNLMVGPDGRLTVIDFQDALQGPRVYDLVALLCDSYVPLDLELQTAMIERYAALRRIPTELLRTEFWQVTLHRKLKDAGRFIYIDRVRKNPDFLQWYPQSLEYVGRALRESPALGDLEEVLRRLIPGFPEAVEKPASILE